MAKYYESEDESQACKSCGEVKPLQEFRKHSGYKNGRVSKCNPCYKEAHKESIAKAQKKFYEKNKARLNAARTLRQKNAPEEVKRERSRYEKAWRQKNKGWVYAYNAEVRAKKRQATPPWLNEEHRDRIASIYKTRLKVTERTGKEHHVDHIVPIQGKNVCGLHVPWNLAIIPAEMNLEKSNSFSGGWYDQVL